MRILKIYIAILILSLPFTFACEDFLIKEDIEDLVFYESKISDNLCEAYYDSPNLAYEAKISIIEWETEERAKIITRERIISELNSDTLIRKFGEKFLYYQASSQEYYRWQDDVYTIEVSGDIDFEADDCDGFLCLVEEYSNTIGNDMETIFPDSSCDKWEETLFNGAIQDVCVEYYGDIYTSEVNPVIYCKNKLDCPGEGKPILSKNSRYPKFETSSETYYIFRCDNHRCRYDKRIANECMSDVDCNENKKCDLGQTPTKCVYCTKDIHCEDNEVCSGGYCQKLICDDDQKVGNHRCKDIACPQNYFAFNHSCFECNGDEYSKNNKCMILDCLDTQHALNHACINLICKDDEIAKDHKCVKLNCKDDEFASNHKCNKLVCNFFTHPRNHECNINYIVVSLISLGIILFIVVIIILIIKKR